MKKRTSCLNLATWICLVSILLNLQFAYSQPSPAHSLLVKSSSNPSTHHSDVKVHRPELWESKLDAATRFLMAEYAATRAQIRPRANATDGRIPKRLEQKYGIMQDDNNQWIVDVFIQVDQTADASALASFGLVADAKVHDIIIGHIPLSSIPGIAKQESVEMIQVSQKSNLLMNASRAEINVDAVHRGFNLPTAFNGDGVIVGVLDSGIDFSHPDFFDANGSRIRYLYEMTRDGGEKEWTKQQIDTNPDFISQRDGNGGGGHGTHVTGTAAGSGRSNGSFAGIAPNADIIFVKAVRDADSDGGFSNADVIKGCQYIFEKADELDKPAVINLSLGGNYGPHDGTTLYEQSLSGLTGPGRLIVAAAGNAGDDLIHAEANLTRSKANVGIFWATDTTMYVDAWYTNAAVDSITIVTWMPDAYNNFSIQNYTRIIAAGESIQDTPLYGGENTPFENTVLAYVSIDAITTNDSENGDGQIFFEINSSEAVDLTTVPLAIFLTNKRSGYIDAWVGSGGHFITSADYSLFNNVSQFMPVIGNNSSSCGIPSTADKVISVGSYVTKNAWVDIDGYQRYWPNAAYPYTIGELSSFSSLGPTRDGRLFPDISAPGEEIFSCLSSHLDEGVGYERYKVLSGRKYHGMHGTSMASPHVTGVVALMLQAQPNLDYDDALAILQETARGDDFAGALPNYSFGYGKVDALAALQVLAPSQPTTLFAEGFETDFPPKNWRHFENGENTWYRGYFRNDEYCFSRIDPSSQYSAMCDADSLEIQNESLASPPYSFEANRNYMLDFYTLYHPFFQDSASISLWVSTDGFESYDLMWNSAKESDDGAGWAWRKTTIDLSRYQGFANVHLVWQYYGRNGGFVALDGISLKLSTDIELKTDALPERYVLQQNYPNPFNMQTTIQYEIGRTENVQLKIYNITGQQIRVLVDEKQQPGSHVVLWDGCDAKGLAKASGLYLYRLQTENFQTIKRMILLK